MLTVCRRYSALHRICQHFQSKHLFMAMLNFSLKSDNHVLTRKPRYRGVLNMVNGTYIRIDPISNSKVIIFKEL